MRRSARRRSAAPGRPGATSRAARGSCAASRAGTPAPRTPGSRPTRVASTASCGPCRPPSAGARTPTADPRTGRGPGTRPRPARRRAARPRPAAACSSTWRGVTDSRSSPRQIERDALREVVDRVRQRVGRRPVRADQDRVGDLRPLEADLAADQVVDDDRAVRRGWQAQRGRPALGGEPLELLGGVTELGRLDDRRTVALAGAGASHATPRVPRRCGGRGRGARPPRAGAPPRRTARSAATAGTGRTRRVELPVGSAGPGPRPSPGRPSPAPPPSTAWSPRSPARRRCPRCGTRTSRRGGGRAASCRALLGRCRRAAPRGGGAEAHTDRSGRGHGAPGGSRTVEGTMLRATPRPAGS